MWNRVERDIQQLKNLNEEILGEILAAAVVSGKPSKTKDVEALIKDAAASRDEITKWATSDNYKGVGDGQIKPLIAELQEAKEHLSKVNISHARNLARARPKQETGNYAVYKTPAS